MSDQHPGSPEQDTTRKTRLPGFGTIFLLLTVASPVLRFIAAALRDLTPGTYSSAFVYTGAALAFAGAALLPLLLNINRPNGQKDNS